ncbi:MAG TPA: DSD1 family PLP-dependent enzyme [Burkholderiaceae bacterium]|nr:DSD1 family PLP-dependent enzyme [Burkholderiaceae bacterium]
MRLDWIPAQRGDSLKQVDTPALILDLDKFEANLTRMAQAAASSAVRLRPHAKTHKCVEIARRQINAGAVGICVQKMGEAEVFLGGDIPDVLITNEIAGDQKLRRLAQLARRFTDSKLGVCVDDAESARRLATLCAEEQARLDVYVEVDVGQNRGGVPDAEVAVQVARVVAASGFLHLAGLHAYAGSAQHRRGAPERRAAVKHAAARAAEVRDALVAANLSCDVITGGGTGTFPYDATSGVYNEIQPGSYLFMDVDYKRNEQDPDAPVFDNALFVLTTVMSQRGERATLDAGLKAFSTDSGPARPTFDGWRVHSVSDEHTVLTRIADGGPAIKIGAKALLVPGHCDPTVNLHDWIVAVRQGTVEAVWPVDARGAVY